MHTIAAIICLISLSALTCVHAASSSVGQESASGAAPLVAKYIGNNSGLWDSYYLELIEKALKNTESEGAYRIESAEESLSTVRKWELLVKGERINIDRLTGFSSKKNQQSGLIRVNVPLMRGLHGFRILLIHKELQAQFDKVNLIEDLRRFTFGFGRGWEGYIYQKEGFKLIEAQDMASLLKMLAAKRFDFIPLAATEIEDSYNIDKNLLNTLVAEKHLLIYMPMPIFFYVSEQNPVLAKRVERGLLAMEASGEMKSVFDKYFAERLRKLNLSSRVIIEIPNFENDGKTEKMNINFLKEY